MIQSTNNHLLIVEDDELLAEYLKRMLVSQGYRVSISRNGSDALTVILETRPDLVILDVNLPLLSGYSVCCEVRKSSQIPIIMLSAKSDEDSHQRGLEAGANAYEFKPPRMGVLLLHISRLLKNIDERESQLTFGKLKISLNSRLVTLDKVTVELTTQEFDLLVLLAENAGIPMSRDQILETLRGIDYDGFDRSIDMRISTLRKKLKVNGNPDRIKTVRRVGYLFVGSAE